MGIDVRGGIVDAKTVRGGPIHIAPKSKWKGDCQAQQVIIEKGVALIDGHFDFPNNELGLDSLHPENRHRLAPAPPPEDAQDIVETIATPTALTKKKASGKIESNNTTPETPAPKTPAKTATKKSVKKKSSTSKKKKTSTTRQKPSS